MVNGKIKISLCDLANDFNGIDNKSIPIGVGYVASYCKKIHGDAVDIEVHRTYKSFWDDVENSAPDIAGFGSYDWNHNLTLAVTKKLKQINPSCLVIMGGANAEIDPRDNKKFLSQHEAVDYVVYGDGEKPFSNLVSEYRNLQGKKKWLQVLKGTPIDGCRTLVGDELVLGEPFDAITDMDEVPSPYLNGLFDHILEDPTLMPIIQNIRGCPYLCRFCVSGTQYGKIRNFSLGRIQEEIKFLQENARNRFLRFSDDNFGIVEHDVRVAEFIRENFEKNKYPAGLKVYSAKKQTDRVREVGRILKPLMTYVISFQTTTNDVLKETKRVSAKHDEATESLEYCRNNGLSTATELIFGLPGETLDSWKEVIDTTLSYGFDSVSMNPLWLLKGADLNRSEARKENEYVGKFMLAENAVTSYDDFFSIERDEIAVQSKNYSFDEWKTFLKYQIFILTLSYFGYGKELIYYASNMGLKPTRLFDHILDNPDQYPTSNELVAAYVKNYTANMYDSEEELYEFIHSNLDKFRDDKESLVRIGKSRGLFGYLVKYILRDPDKKYLRELADAIIELNGAKSTQEEVDFLFDLAVTLMIDPFKEFVPDITIESQYDIFRWAKDGYSKPLMEYENEVSQTVELKCRNPITVSETIKKDREYNRTDCFHFFRYMNSGLMRRYIYDSEVDMSSNSPWEPFRREHRTTSTVPNNPSDTITLRVNGQ